MSENLMGVFFDSHCRINLWKFQNLHSSMSVTDTDRQTDRMAVHVLCWHAVCSFTKSFVLRCFLMKFLCCFS